MGRTIRTNFLLNVAGLVLPFGAALITVPIYIAQIGAARYGILSVVWILLGYFGFLDLGLSRASANALSRLSGAGASERVPVLVTSLYLNAVLGVLGGLLLYALSTVLIGRFAHLPPDLAAEVDTALPWIACMLPVALISAVGGGAIESRERFLAANLLASFGGVLGQVAPVLCAVLIAPTLDVVIPAAFAARLVSTLVIWAVVLHGERPVRLRHFDRGRVRELMGYGAWVSVTSMIGPLLESFDQLLIGTLLGPVAIAHYAVPMSISTRLLVIAHALSKTLFPRLSRLGREEARALAGRAIVTLAFGFALVCGPAALLAETGLRLWVGDEFAVHATPVAQILLVGIWANGIAAIPYTFLQGQGRPDLTAKVQAAEVLPFIAMLYVLTTRFGLPGAALAWTVRTSVECVVLMVVSGHWDRRLLQALPAVALVAACWAVAAFVPLTMAAATGAALLAGLCIAAVATVADPGTRAAVRDLVGSQPRFGRP